MDQALDITQLRRRLGDRLRQVLAAPTIEDKELAAFDIVMSRRELLRNAGVAAAVVGLVDAGVPPTLWGRSEPALHVPASAVGLTLQDQSSIARASKLSIATELFTETVYAEPVVPSGVVLSHALIEGARNRLRVQSAREDPASGDPPAETAFLDRGYHWGPPELIQLEETPGGWELVHYRHPWGPRTDGPGTDSLVRDVIMGIGDGLVDPISVHTISSPYNNQYTPGTAPSSGVVYVVVVTDHTVSGAGWMCVGLGSWSVGAPYADAGDYPVEWRSWQLGVLNPEAALSTELWAADRYTQQGHADAAAPSVYEPLASTEHIVLHYDQGIALITLDDDGNRDDIQVVTDWLPYPSSTQGSSDLPRIVHTEPGSERRYIVLMRSSTDSDNRPVHRSWEIDSSKATMITPEEVWNGRVTARLRVSDPATYVTIETTSTAPAPTDHLLVYQNVSHVHGLYTVEDDAGRTYHVKLASFGSTVALFVIANQGFRLAGHLPLGLPDAPPHGLGHVTLLTGGVSKFGGFRFVVSDANKNVFLVRQRRLALEDSPYGPPIHGFNNAIGQERTQYSTTSRDTHQTIDGDSPIHQLVPWLDASNSGTSSSPSADATFNVLLNAMLAFGTDDTYAAQGAWLGSTFFAAYAPRRFGYDSAHVVVESAQGQPDEYGAYSMFSHPVHQTWTTRPIATQTYPAAPGLSESGEHYQATIGMLNAYDRPVSPGSTDNAGLLVEVRADEPTTVVDQTHNLYHDVDRYTSFMAAPDLSGKLGLVAKAQTFAQVIYARLVDTDALQPSSDDAAMVAAGGSTADWQSVDMAVQGQQRMGNTGGDNVASLGDAAPLADTTQYVSSASVQKAVPSSQLKQSFVDANNKDPETSDKNWGNIAGYLNNSGNTLIKVSQQLSLGASPDSQTIDPLTAVTVPSTALLADQPTIATAFAYTGGNAYTAGTVSMSDTPPGDPTGDLGSIFSDISHAIHDALHWVQHATEEAIDALGSDAAIVLTVTKSELKAYVSKEIMKAVNGVESAVDQVVSTVEEYGSIVANLVVTIVEQSYLFRMIEDLILLISLLIHLGDIQKLRDDLVTRFPDLEIPATVKLPTAESLFGDYFGSGSQTTTELAKFDSSNVGDEIVAGVVDAVINNPLTSKIINKLLAAAAQAFNDLLPTPPVSFDVDEQAASDFVSDVNDVIGILDAAFGNFATETAEIETFAKDLATTIVDPHGAMESIKKDLGAVTAEIEGDLDAVFDKIDELAADGLAMAQGMIDESAFLTVDLVWLADALNLFGMGKTDGGKLSVSSNDTFFFPMAVLLWVSVYTHEGHSIRGLPADASTPPELLEDSFLTVSQWNIARISLGAYLAEAGGMMWFITSGTGNAAATPSGKILLLLGDLFNGIRRTADVFYIAATYDEVEPKTWDLLYGLVRLGTAIGGIGARFKDATGAVEMVSFANAIAATGIVIYDSANAATNNVQKVLEIVGQDISRTQPLATAIWSKLPTASKNDLRTPFTIWIVGAPAGLVIQAAALASEPATEPDGPAVVVVTGSGSTAGADLALVQRLESGHGATVTVVDGDTLLAESLPPAELVVVSSSLTLRRARHWDVVRDRIPATTPVLASHATTFRQLGLARRSGTTQLRGRAIRFPDVDHPAADGQSGTTEVLDTLGNRVNWAMGVGDATVIAREPRPPWRSICFAYEVGDRRPDGATAQARAIGWFVSDSGWDRLTEAGWQLFDAAVDWLTEL